MIDSQSGTYPLRLPGTSQGQPHAEAAYRNVLCSLVNRDTEWLDLGCGRSLIRDWLPGAHDVQMQLRHTCKRIAGIDLEKADVDRNPYIHEAYVGSVEQLPFADRSFSLVTAQMVVEHVSAPLAMLKECARVLVPGGHFLFITPNLKNLLIAAASIVPDAIKRPLTSLAQMRDANDIFPTRYRMNTSAAIEKTLSLAGMTPELIEHIDGFPDLTGLPFVSLVERLIRAIQPQTCRSDLLVLARKPAS
ncbi:MAG TPA: class I SAM-dependent methyltransferase [Steroidobacteraceae bacterium]|jgi:SAM-dependent methyltransferase|nr:class I SAM-dependent methyltransferase [Steroidobacteraceae bacterium]